jgi:hypothetical protein
MRAVLLTAALIVCASATGCHQIGRRHGDICETCAPGGHHGVGHRAHHGGRGHGGLFHKKSDMCDVCAADGAIGPYTGPSGPFGPTDAAGGVYGPHAAAAAMSAGPAGYAPDASAAMYGGGYGGAPRYPVRGTPGFPHHHYGREYIGPQGPSTAQVGYPYYTVRGPRDFLMNNPPSIGR